MPQSVYSFLGSPLHLVLDDNIAEGYNSFVDSFLDGQQEYRERTGRKWNGDAPLRMNVRKGANEAYNRVAKVINLMVEINGGGLNLSEEVCMSDYLEKVSDLQMPDRGPLSGTARFDLDRRETRRPRRRFWR